MCVWLWTSLFTFWSSNELISSWTTNIFPKVITLMEISERASLSLPLHAITTSSISADEFFCVSISFWNTFFLWKGVESQREDKGWTDREGKDEKQTKNRRTQKLCVCVSMCVSAFVNINLAAKGWDPLCKLLIVSHCSVGLWTLRRNRWHPDLLSELRVSVCVCVTQLPSSWGYVGSRLKASRPWHPKTRRQRRRCVAPARTRRGRQCSGDVQTQACVKTRSRSYTTEARVYIWNHKHNFQS